MFKLNKYLLLFLIGCTIFFISGCESGKQKSEENNAVAPKTEISKELLKEHNDLLLKANQEIHNINLKLTELNEKICAYNEKGGKLSQAQNKEIDDIEKIRTTINPRIHEINSVSQEQWENFKTAFEKDINEVKSRIDVLLNEIKVK